MKMRRLPILAAALLAILVWAAPAVAGNWATARMDGPAPTPIAGAETAFGFEVLQHGVTPVSWVTATFVATNLATKAQIQAPMHAVGADGHFETSITFPEPGEWTWYVLLAELGTDQDGAGGTLTVTAGDASAAEAGPVAQLAELERRLDAALDRLAALEQRLAALEARTTATDRR